VAEVRSLAAAVSNKHVAYMEAVSKFLGACHCLSFRAASAAGGSTSALFPEGTDTTIDSNMPPVPFHSSSDLSDPHTQEVASEPNLSSLNDLNASFPIGPLESRTSPGLDFDTFFASCFNTEGATTSSLNDHSVPTCKFYRPSE
jgi:hypothetical protein